MEKQCNSQGKDDLKEEQTEKLTQQLNNKFNDIFGSNMSSKKVVIAPKLGYREPFITILLMICVIVIKLVPYDIIPEKIENIVIYWHKKIITELIKKTTFAEVEKFIQTNVIQSAQNISANQQIDRLVQFLKESTNYIMKAGQEQQLVIKMSSLLARLFSYGEFKLYHNKTFILLIVFVEDKLQDLCYEYYKIELEKRIQQQKDRSFDASHEHRIKCLNLIVYITQQNYHIPKNCKNKYFDLCRSGVLEDKIYLKLSNNPKLVTEEIPLQNDYFLRPFTI